MRIPNIFLIFVVATGCGDDSAASTRVDERGCPDEPGALDLATGDVCGALAIEVDAVEGHDARGAALDTLATQLGDLAGSGHFGKPDGISIVVDEEDIAPSTEADHAYTFAELRELIDAHRSYARAEGEAAIHLLYVDGHFEDDTSQSRVLGFAYGHSRIVMFRASIDDGCEAALALVRDRVCNLAESTVLLHEVGHLLGLVDNGLPMVSDHKDEEHGAHDVDEDCIMYYLSETSQMIPLLIDNVTGGDESVTPFDDRCLEDLEAAQM
ncbi:MAG: hypothetical protein AABZ30_07180 [Myxococcota bacterium]